MDKELCKNCAHYRQHYVFDQRKIFRIYCGRCTVRKVKTKKPDADACENFVPTPPDEEAFASREYLSKVLLKHMLKLELLPEIADMEDKTEKDSLV